MGDQVGVAVRQPMLAFEMLDDLAVLGELGRLGDLELLFERFARLHLEVGNHRGETFFGGGHANSPSLSGKRSFQPRFTAVQALVAPARTSHSIPVLPKWMPSGRRLLAFSTA